MMQVGFWCGNFTSFQDSYFVGNIFYQFLGVKIKFLIITEKFKKIMMKPKKI
jgi:hypothetical protein